MALYGTRQWHLFLLQLLQNILKLLLFKIIALYICVCVFFYCLYINNFNGENKQSLKMKNGFHHWDKHRNLNKYRYNIKCTYLKINRFKNFTLFFVNSWRSETHIKNNYTTDLSVNRALHFMLSFFKFAQIQNGLSKMSVRNSNPVQRMMYIYF